MTITYRQLAEGICYGLDRRTVIDVTELHQAYKEEAIKNGLTGDDAFVVLFQIGLEVLCVAREINVDNHGTVRHNIPDSYLFSEFQRYVFRDKLTGKGFDYRNTNPLRDLFKVLPGSKLYPYVVSNTNIVLIREWVVKGSKIYVEAQVVDV